MNRCRCENRQTPAPTATPISDFAAKSLSALQTSLTAPKRRRQRKVREFESCDANITHIHLFCFQRAAKGRDPKCDPNPRPATAVAGLERRRNVGRGLKQSMHQLPRGDDPDDAREHHRGLRDIPEVRTAAQATGLKPRATLRAMIISLSRRAHHRLVFPGRRIPIPNGADRARTGNP